MNPLGISHKNNLIIAEDMRTGDRVGWAQIRSLGYAGIESSTTNTVGSSQFEGDNDSLNQRNVQSTLTIEQDVDEEIWQEFDEDTTDFPNGFSSLPWTKEYRAASQAATDRLQRREKMLELELAARPKLWELSSVYVLPKWRQRGIGSALIIQALKQQQQQHAISSSKKQAGTDVYALTLAKTVSWYVDQFEFREEKQVPNVMAVKMGVGRALVNIMTGEKLVCIRITL